MTKSSDVRTKAVASRPVRKRLAQRGPMYAPQRAGYRRRWVNIVKNNVEDMLRLGYDIVVEGAKDGTYFGEYEGAHKLGTATTRVVDQARGIKAILMETTNELFEQGRAEKTKLADEVMARTIPDDVEDPKRNITFKQRNI